MQIRLSHPNLSVFRSFGGAYDNENNTTRAFLIVLARSPWGSVLLRALLDTLARKLAQGAGSLGDSFAKYLSSWPDECEISMQQAIGEEFLSEGVECGILLEVVPDVEVERVRASVPPELSGGIVDGMITIRSIEEDADEATGLAIVIESKLYGGVGDEQRSRYRKAMASKLDDRQTHVVMSWDEVYRLTDALPAAAEADPIVEDFKRFLDARPDLVSFTGFQLGDLNDRHVLDVRMRRLCERLAGQESLEAHRGGKFKLCGQPQRKKGGCDYDLPLAGQDELHGNIGIGQFVDRAVSIKLVSGWRTNWETRYILDRSWNHPTVTECLSELGASGMFVAEVFVRLYFNRFDTPAVGIWKQGPQPRSVVGGWQDGVDLMREFHRTVATDDVLDRLELLSRDGTSADPEAIARARLQPMAQRPKCFAAAVFCLERNWEKLCAEPAKRQSELVRDDLLRMARLLFALSGK